MEIPWLLTNYITTFYGCILTFVFAGLAYTRYDRYYAATVCLFFVVVQFLFSLFFDIALYIKLYPLTTHLPLLLLLILHRKKSWLVSCVAMFSAYLFCILLKCLGHSAALLFGKTDIVYYGTQIASVPILIYASYRWFAPYLEACNRESPTSLILLLIPTASCYLLTFAAYAKIFSSQTNVIYSMLIVFIVLYITLTIILFKKNFHKNALKAERQIFNLQVAQTKIMLDNLYNSEQQTRLYRHDLRHHLQYIKSLLDEEKSSEAISYIQEIHNQVSETKIIRYCDNESINMLLSAYLLRARKNDISCQVIAKVAEQTTISAVDLCVIIANALENAIHAISKIPEIEERKLKVRIEQQQHRLLLEFTNSYHEPIIIHDGLPTAQEAGHGSGIISIVKTVESYQGIYHFTLVDHQLTLRIVLQEKPLLVKKRGLDL